MQSSPAGRGCAVAIHLDAELVWMVGLWEDPEGIDPAEGMENQTVVKTAMQVVGCDWKLEARGG